MKKLILLSILFIVGCEDSSLNDISKNTYYDDIADITYTTNSLSGNINLHINRLKMLHPPPPLNIQKHGTKDSNTVDV